MFHDSFNMKDGVKSRVALEHSALYRGLIACTEIILSPNQNKEKYRIVWNTTDIARAQNKSYGCCKSLAFSVNTVMLSTCSQYLTEDEAYGP